MNATQKLYASMLAIFTNFYDLYINPTAKTVTLKNAKINENGTVEDVNLDNIAKVKGNFEAWKNTLVNIKTVTIPKLTVTANTNTAIANFKNMGLSAGVYTVQINWSSIRDTNNTNLIWYGGVSGNFYLYSVNVYNSAPFENLLVNGTVHHRRIPMPTFVIDGLNNIANSNYSDMGLFIKFDRDVIINNLTIKITKIGA